MSHDINMTTTKNEDNSTLHDDIATTAISTEATKEVEEQTTSQYTRPTSKAEKSNLVASLRLSHPFWMLCCPNCGSDVNVRQQQHEEEDETLLSKQIIPIPSKPISRNSSVRELINQYISYCHLYTTPNVRVNPGVLTALRFSLPHVRVTGDFHDADMLAFVDLLLEHCNTSLRHVRRLDFSVGSQRGKLHGLKGFTSHGAYALAQVLRSSENIKEVYLHRNRLGHFGANAIFSGT